MIQKRKRKRFANIYYFPKSFYDCTSYFIEISGSVHSILEGQGNLIKFEMNKFNFDKISHESMVGLAQDLLNQVFGLDLQSFTARGKKGPELWQPKTNSPAPEVVASILGQIEVTETFGILKLMELHVQEVKPLSYLLVAFSRLHQNIVDQLNAYMQKIIAGKFEVFDLDWVEAELYKYPGIQEKWGVKLIEERSGSKQQADNSFTEGSIVDPYKKGKSKITSDYEINDSKEFREIVAIENLISHRSSGYYWWLNVTQDRLVIEDVNVGSIYNEDVVFSDLDIKSDLNNLHPGDLVIGFQASPNREVKGLFEVYEIYPQRNQIHFKLLYKFTKAVSRKKLEQLTNFDLLLLNSEKLQGNLWRIHRSVFEEVIQSTELSLIRESADKKRGNKENVEEDSPTIKTKDNIPFHLDQIEVTDRLNRESIAKSLSRLLNRDIFKKENHDIKGKENKGKKKEKKVERAFMVHLQGAWGEGKSTFLNLLTKQLDTDEKKWIVVNFNAWQNQHITPPWWTFIDTIYRQVSDKLDWFENIRFRWKEQRRRLFWYKSFYKIFLLLLTIFFLGLIYYFSASIFETASEITPDNNHETATKGLGFSLLKDIIIGLVAIVGAVYSFGKFLATPLFLTSSQSAKSFMEHADDPMKKVKKHFESIVNNVEKSGHHLAIYIDDLDRCNATFTVELLEGIQTLFTDKKVLYVVAGDRQWISTCFENHYKDYHGIVRQPAQKLGYLFLEKAFQLSIRLPKISGITKKEYWQYILNIEENNTEENKELTDEKRQEVIQEMRKEVSNEDYTSPAKMNELKEKHNLKSHQITDLALEILDVDTEEIKHILQDHHDLIDANPRSIKRLANQYNIYRNTLIVEQKEFDKNKLFRWLMLQNKYPVFTDWVELNLHNLVDQFVLDERFKGLEKDAFWMELMYDRRNLKGGKLETNDIAIFVGVE